MNLYAWMTWNRILVNLSKTLILHGGFKPQGREDEWDQEIKQFNQFLNAKGLQVCDVEGDGNCLFYALSEQIGVDHKGVGDHNEFRLLVKQQLESNIEYYQKKCEGDINEHIRKVTQDGEWGDTLDIIAISDALKWRIVVYMKPEKDEEGFFELRYDPEGCEPVKTVYILHSYKFKHFMSTRPNQRYVGNYVKLEEGQFGRVYYAKHVIS